MTNRPNYRQCAEVVERFIKKRRYGAAREILAEARRQFEEHERKVQEEVRVDDYEESQDYRGTMGTAMSHFSECNEFKAIKALEERLKKLAI